MSHSSNRPRSRASASVLHVPVTNLGTAASNLVERYVNPSANRGVMTQSQSWSLPKQERHTKRAYSRAQVFLPAAKFAALILAAILLGIAPPTFAQRGGGGGGGAASAGGGSHGGGFSGGGGWSGDGGGGGHASGGGSHGASGGSHAGGGRAGSGTGSRSGAGGIGGKVADSSHRTGFGAAIRHFFGLPSASKPSVQVPAVSNAAFSSSELPPSLTHVRLAPTPQVFAGSKSLKPEIAAPPRPISPHPRHGPYYPPYGYYCYGCEFGLGFDFGYGFGLFSLFDFGYYDWYPNLWQPHPTTYRTDMILYLGDGSALEVSDYCVEGDTLRYVTDDGKKGSVAVRDLDLGRTTEANQRLGLKFTMDRTQCGGPFEQIQPPQ